jgi:exodeoxyribonuclease V beta subunit
LGALEQLEQSAMGYLLAGGAPISPDDFARYLDAFKGECEAIAVVPAPESKGDSFREPDWETTSFRARVPLRAARENWWIASYSALRQVDKDNAGLLDQTAETAAEETYQEGLSVVEPEAITGEVGPPPAGGINWTAGRASLHDFPAGAEAGTFLHDLLEWSANRGFADTLAQPEVLRDQIARRCQLRGWAHWVDPLTDWLLQFLDLPLNTGLATAPVTLAGLRAYRAEMEFWLAASAVNTRAIDRLVRRHALTGQTRPELQPMELNGMLKGFIDLVFEHEGRYYVADYKSNKLGPEDAAYTPAALWEAILHSRHELQYVLYLLALHRHLQSRLADYDYDRHVGGAVYLFLRGAWSPTQGLHAERPPRVLIEALDRLFSAGHTAACSESSA